MLDIEQMSRFVSPVNPSIYPHLTALLLGIGIFYMAWFFVYEVTSTKLTRDLVKELALAVIAALFMGVGTVFLALTVGIYV
ncbi:transmembrane protein 258-like [Pollicipes pollicipes]|uniref:transmembrane protein 258-like n=1 Tax=Pollicipes pollicipes TaxID=41117 RepID=UPI0018857C5E|nr:transmembrane protein 258-like [Pollicipes pollicipes]XP_037071491.1 transmembrane protein 258-like [Pollicipes pollicipes]